MVLALFIHLKLQGSVSATIRACLLMDSWDVKKAFEWRENAKLRFMPASLNNVHTEIMTG